MKLFKVDDNEELTVLQKALLEYGICHQDSSDAIIAQRLYTRALNIKHSDYILGRPKKVSFEDVQELKNKGYKQEEVSRMLSVSVKTVVRNWNRPKYKD